MKVETGDATYNSHVPKNTQKNELAKFSGGIQQWMVGIFMQLSYLKNMVW